MELVKNEIEGIDYLVQLCTKLKSNEEELKLNPECPKIIMKKYELLKEITKCTAWEQEAIGYHPLFLQEIKNGIDCETCISECTTKTAVNA